ncbi:MAG: hypothetical protein ACEY26_01135, partial [Candidatus Hodgkinia cicadicola]
MAWKRWSGEGFLGIARLIGRKWEGRLEREGRKKFLPKVSFEPQTLWKERVEDVAVYLGTMTFTQRAGEGQNEWAQVVLTTAAIELSEERDRAERELAAAEVRRNLIELTA